MDSTNENLSKRLYEVLDVIGASEYTRRKYFELAMLYEITFTMFNEMFMSIKRSYYQVGSISEGTTTLSLASDVDLIGCHEDNPVVNSLVEANQQGISYLILDDAFTKPGYVRLQIVNNKNPCSVGMCDLSEDSTCTLKLDWKGRICKAHILGFIAGRHVTRNGPADTLSGINGNTPRDLVYALRCRKIPKSANSWLYRTRAYDWPSQKQLKAMGSYGCFVVGVGHPHSENKSIEWRISFSLQERDLMLTLNETQHKCYILLKMVKKDIIESRTGESISSYHCKTSLLYTIENSQNHIWNNGNLILCLRLCLIRLLTFVKDRNCPNYFIPEENMFDKLDPLTLKRVEFVLKEIICSGVDFLYLIKRDNVGELLKSPKCCSEMDDNWVNRSYMKELHTTVFNGFTSNAECIYCFRNMFMEYMHKSSTMDMSDMNKTKRLLLYLQNTNHITEHTTRDVRLTLDSIIPHIQLQYEQCMFAQYLSRRESSIIWARTIAIQNVVSETKQISETGLDCDLISSKLALASLYIQSNLFVEECNRILVSCENSLEPYSASVCACDKSRRFYHVNNLAAILRKNGLGRIYITGCMVFLPSQVSLVHKALHYELFRTVFTVPESDLVMKKSYWLNWITIDSHTYLYFLQYLFAYNIQLMTGIVSYVRKINQVLILDRNLGHRDTGFNILGWIYLHENKIHDAWESFCKSWIIRPFRNAAKWHMLILLCDIIKGNKSLHQECDSCACTCTSTYSSTNF